MNEDVDVQIEFKIQTKRPKSPGDFFFFLVFTAPDFVAGSDSRVSVPANAAAVPPMNRPHYNHLQSNSISNCHECGISQSVCWILHNVRFKASFRRLCTNCVLKNNLSRFCPLCFDIYDDSTPPSSHQRVMCFRCPSISHISCTSFRFSSTFLCPLCSDPCFAFFDGFDSGSLRQSELAVSVLAGRDGKSAKAIVAAARVVAQSMRRAAADARAVAEMKFRNAVFAKKQATLALERLAYLVLQEKDRNGYAKTNGNAAAGAVEEEEETELQGEVVTAILERMKANQTQF